MSQQFLPEWKGTILALSERHHGGMSFNRHEVIEVARNRRRFLGELGLNLDDCVGPELVHGIRVALVGAVDRGRGASSPDGCIPQTDALITSEPGLILTTTHADCTPVYFYCPEKGIGLAHAGWRGILAGLPAKVVEVMRIHFACQPQEVKIAIGPTICSRHYPVGSDVAKAFKTRFGNEVFILIGDRIHLNLAAAILHDLISAGIPTTNIEKPRACSYCEPGLSSWRRDGDDVKPMLALITMKPKTIDVFFEYRIRV